MARKQKFGIGEIATSPHRWMGDSGLFKMLGVFALGESTRFNPVSQLRNVVAEPFDAPSHLTNVGLSFAVVGMVAPVVDAAYRRYVDRTTPQDTNPATVRKRFMALGAAAGIVANAILESRLGHTVWPWDTTPDLVDFAYGSVAAVGAAYVLPDGQGISESVAMINEARMPDAATKTP